MKLNNHNEPLSSLTHFVAMLLSIAGLTLLTVFASLYSSAWHIVAFSIFGASLVLLYLASSFYHIAPSHHKIKRILQKIDHSMIYVLIAGTYTPICLVPLRGGWGWSIFGVIWGLAILGIILKTTSKKIKGWFSALFYILIGWLILIAFLPLMESLPAHGLGWLVAGGISYTLGTIFFGLDHIVPRTRWFGMHEVFHLFVIGGSFSHFWVMFKYVLYI